MIKKIENKKKLIKKVWGGGKKLLGCTSSLTQHQRLGNKNEIKNSSIK